MKRKKEFSIRLGCKDMWNAFMVDGAEFVIGSDMPICPCTAKTPPSRLISYVDAKHIHRIRNKTEPDYFVDAFVHFYIDDQKFDGHREGIWVKPNEALEIIRHFAGAISPDFSTNEDFPDPLSRFNTYRMRAFGRWLSSNGISMINNVRWGGPETWEYCFDGIPYNSMVAIGTVASGIRKVENRPLFEAGLNKMIDLLNPHTIVVYGSANYKFFNQLSESKVKILVFPSQTSEAYERKRGEGNEQTQ